MHSEASLMLGDAAFLCPGASLYHCLRATGCHEAGMLRHGCKVTATAVRGAVLRGFRVLECGCSQMHSREQ